MAQERELADRGQLFPQRSFFFLNVAGSFRSRAEIWNNVHLGLSPIPNKYGVYPQLSEGTNGGPRETTDFRLRLEPTLYAGEMAQVMGVIDLLSAIAGEEGRSEIAHALSQSYGVDQPGSPASSVDWMYVQALWVEMRLFHAVTLQAGRIPASWGFGIVENDGTAIDADGGDVIDGVAAIVGLGRRLRASISFDYPLEGRVVEDPVAPWGAAYDSGDEDDIIQVRLKFWSEPSNETNRLSWGLYSRFRWHDFSSQNSKSPFPECSQYPWTPAYSCNELFWREAFIWTPDAFISGTYRIGDELTLSFRAEIAGRYGSMGSTRLVTPSPSGRTLYGLGGTVHATLAWPAFRVHFDASGASGDDGTIAFGLLDRPLLGEPDSTRGGGSGLKVPDDTLTVFALHPNYFVDLILFRRVVGAVTNAVYAKPGVGVDLWKSGDTLLSLDASAMYALAFIASATPGESNHLGVETDIGLRLETGKHVTALVDFGMLFPLDGLSRASTLHEPTPWTARALLNVEW